MAPIHEGRPNNSSEAEKASMLLPSPSKRNKTEMEAHEYDELDFGDGNGSESSEKLQSPSSSPSGSVRRREPKRKPAVIQRLGDIFAMAARDTEDFERRQAREVKFKPPLSSQSPTSSGYERETDPAVLARKWKQIDYGKNTPEYAAYIAAIPKEARERHHPQSPNPKRKYGRRAWDGAIKAWRINLHTWHTRSAKEVALEKEQKKHLNESFSSEASAASTSTTSSMMGEVRDIKAEFEEEDEDADKTLVKSSSTGTSWFDECEEYEKEQKKNQVHNRDEDEEDESVRVHV